MAAAGARTPRIMKTKGIMARNMMAITQKASTNDSMAACCCT
jgi:hypothetical protein